MFDGQEMRIVDAFKHPEVLDELVAIVEDPATVIIGHNLKFDMSFARAHANRRIRPSNIHDTMLAEQVLMAGWSWPYYDKAKNETKKRMPEFSLAALVMRHLGEKMDKSMQRSDWGAADITEEQLKYAGRDVEVLMPIYEIQLKLLDTNNLTHIAKLEFDTLAPIIEMEFVGMPFEWSEAEKLREIKVKEVAAAFKDLEGEARGTQKSRQVTLFGDDAGVDTNFRSPAQITKYLREKLGLQVDSSDVETLKGIDHPFAAKLLKYRGLEKQVQFIAQFEEYGAKSGRLYPYYNQCRAATGRMSSSKPNGQQIPKRGDGKIFRTLFKAKPGMKLVKVDYAAIEMRVMAALSNDKSMIDAIANGVDLHKLTASKTSGKEMSEVTKEDRQRAKAVNFGLIYGMSAPTLKKYAWFNYGVRMTEEEAVQTRNAFFNSYTGIEKWHRDQKQMMQKGQPYTMHTADKGYYITYVTIQRTLLGRKRFWPNFAGTTTAKPTEVLNSSDQGTSADITKLALIELYKVLPDNAQLVATVHDEIVVECPEEIAEDIAKLMVEKMCAAASSVLKTVKVDAEAEIHQSWGG
jgi:DNA polymerase I-like protein with 3'-5' exonuclease and polymerase domains